MRQQRCLSHPYALPLSSRFQAAQSALIGSQLTMAGLTANSAYELDLIESETRAAIAAAKAAVSTMVGRLEAMKGELLADQSAYADRIEERSSHVRRLEGRLLFIAAIKQKVLGFGPRIGIAPRGAAAGIRARRFVAEEDERERARAHARVSALAREDALEIDEDEDEEEEEDDDDDDDEQSAADFFDDAGECSADGLY